MKRRTAALVAVVLAGLVIVGQPMAFPLCVLYTPDDPEYYVFFCYLKDTAADVARDGGAW